VGKLGPYESAFEDGGSNFYETSVNFREGMRYHISKDRILHNFRPETSNLALFQRPKIRLDGDTSRKCSYEA